MAETETQERTEHATQKRLDEARKKGQIPRSRELTAAAVMIAAGVRCCSLGRGARRRSSRELMRSGLTHRPRAGLGRAASLAGARRRWRSRRCGSSRRCSAHAGRGAGRAAGARRLDLQRQGADAGLLAAESRRAGLGRMFSARGWVELGKALAKFAVVGDAGALVLWHERRPTAGPRRASRCTAPSATRMRSPARRCSRCAAALVLIAAVDVPFQLWQHHKRHADDARGDPRGKQGVAKARPRSRAASARCSARWRERRMMDDVPKADVVVTNPTHFAVALRYDDKTHARADRSWPRAWT